MALTAPDIRLPETAERGQTLEVIVALRGRVRRARDGKGWRLRAQGGRLVTFPADWVVAVTPAGPGRGPKATNISKVSTTRRSQ
jgi:hypothetical protein